MIRGCVWSEKRSKNRTLSDIKEGERNGRVVGGTLWNSGDDGCSSTKVCAALAAQVDWLPSYPCSQVWPCDFIPTTGVLGRNGGGPSPPRL